MSGAADFLATVLLAGFGLFALVVALGAVLLFVAYIASRAEEKRRLSRGRD